MTEVVPSAERVLAGGGTFTANPMTAVAGLATLDVIDAEPVYDHTELLGERVRDSLDAVFEGEGVDGAALGFSSMVQVVFAPERPLDSPTDVKEATDKAAVKEFHSRLYDRGYFFNQGSMGNVSYAVTEDHVEGCSTRPARSSGGCGRTA